LVSLRMSHVAESTGIGRATLYKYFPDMPSLLVAWHERQVADHLEHLVAVREQHANPVNGLAAVLEAYAHMSHGHHGTRSPRSCTAASTWPERTPGSRRSSAISSPRARAAATSAMTSRPRSSRSIASTRSGPAPT